MQKSGHLNSNSRNSSALNDQESALNPPLTSRSFRLTSPKSKTKIRLVSPMRANMQSSQNKKENYVPAATTPNFYTKKFDWAKAYCIWSTIYYSSLKIKLNSYFSTNRAVIVTNKAKLFISVTYRAKKLQKSNFVELTVKGN